MTDDKQLDHLIGVLYETAIEPHRWSEAMTLCAHYAGGIAAHMLSINKQFNQPVFSVLGGEIMTQENEGDYVSHYINIDPRMSMMEDAPVHEWRSCQDYLNRQFVAGSEFYQDFLIPNGGRFTMAAWVDDGLEEHTVIGIHSTSNNDLFGNAELIAAQRFSGHLQRALRLRTHTQSLQARAELGARAIDALTLAMLIVNATGIILHMNASAEHLLNSKTCGLNCKVGGLSATHPVNKYRLTALIIQATGCPALGGAMFLSDAETRQVFVTPLPAASTFAQDWQTPLALVLVMDAGKTLSPLQFLGKLYDLSPTELRVASALLEGKSPEEYTQEAGVTMNTVRSQLKNLFRKTGTRRQSELVALLSRAPPLRG